MNRVDAYEEYLFRTKQDILESIEMKFKIIKIKFTLLNHLDESRYYGLFYRTLLKQKEIQKKYKNRIKHLDRYYRKKFHNLPISDRHREVARKRLEGIKVMYNLLANSYDVVDKQLKELEYQHKLYTRKQSESKFIVKAKDTLGMSLKAKVEEEEQNLSLIMTVFEHRNNKLLEYAKNIKKLEKLASIEKKVLTSAISFNLLPIHGVGDALSVPFWLGDGAIRLYEQQYKEYKDWKKSKKRNLREIEEELERLEIAC